jgi:hypothetical protein
MPSPISGGSPRAKVSNCPDRGNAARDRRPGPTWALKFARSEGITERSIFGAKTGPDAFVRYRFAARLALGVIQVPVIGRMLDLGQLQECAQDIEVEQGLMIFPVLA